MPELVNPCLLARTPRTLGVARAAAVAIMGVTVVGGCGSTEEAAAPPPTAPATASPTAPAPGPPTAPASGPPTASAKPPGAANAQPAPDGRYAARRGDTPSGIAVQFKVEGGRPVLHQRNVRGPDLILVGQQLKIAGP